MRRKHPHSAPVTWPRHGPLHNLFKRLLTEENIAALGFIHCPEVRKALEEGFGETPPPTVTRKCFIVGGFVVLSKRFGVAKT